MYMVIDCIGIGKYYSCVGRKKDRKKKGNLQYFIIH